MPIRPAVNIYSEICDRYTGWQKHKIMVYCDTDIVNRVSYRGQRKRGTPMHRLFFPPLVWAL